MKAEVAESYQELSKHNGAWSSMGQEDVWQAEVVRIIGRFQRGISPGSITFLGESYLEYYVWATWWNPSHFCL